MTDRTDPAEVADERATLIGFLDYQRATLALKCADLSPAQLARRAAPPSALSLLGLVRHMAEVERGWFDEIAGHTRPDVYSTPENRTLDFDGAVADPEVVERAFRDWRTAIAESDVVLSGTDLAATYLQPRNGEPMSVRWVLVHMIEEYARHNGHADLLREAVDGVTGE
jgi:uncharacterized damage-inducible protein DinB